MTQSSIEQGLFIVTEIQGNDFRMHTKQYTSLEAKEFEITVCPYHMAVYEQECLRSETTTNDDLYFPSRDTYYSIYGIYIFASLCFNLL